MSTKKSFTKSDSHTNLHYLSKQLALNHFYSSNVKLFSTGNEGEYDDKTEEVKRDYVFKQSDIAKDIFDLNGSPSSLGMSKKNPNNTGLSRNILVVGAGCTFNSFQNIPLATQTIDILSDWIKVAEFEDVKISLKYLIDFSKRYKEGKPLNKYLNYTDKDSGEKILDCKVSNKFLIKQFGSDYGVLPVLAKRYNSEYEKWEATVLKRGEKIDFESFLSIISDILSVETVRAAIHSIYDIRHGTTLFYSIVAHLFKNRFIDVIINFNFDELLDDAIKEELGSTGYDKILSDGDCVPIDDISKGGRLRQPLYIKPHGTASHKSTLRFTKDHYHELPSDMRTFIESLISGRDEEEIDYRPVNLITAGFNMNSVEFNDILRKYLPKKSSIFNLFFHIEDLESETLAFTKSIEKVFLNSFNKPFIYNIAHELYKKQKDYSLFNGVIFEKKYFHQSNCSMGNTAYLLFLNISEFFNPIYKPRSIYRHLLLNSLFGNRVFWNQVLDTEDLKNEKSKSISDVSSKLSYYPKKYFTSADYFKDRILIEIFINLVINVGKIDPQNLMEGTTGYFYSLYAKHIKKKDKLISIIQFLKEFNFEEDKNPNSLGVRYLRINKDGVKNPQDVFNRLFDKFFGNAISKNSNFSPKYRIYLEKHCDKNLIKEYFNEVLLADNSKIHSDFRNFGYHVFQDYDHTDLINTNLLNDLNFTFGLNSPYSKKKVNRICVIADNGYQIAKFLPQIYQKYKENNGDLKIFLIIQDHFNGKKSFSYQRKNAVDTLLGKVENNEEYVAFLNDEDILNILVLPVMDHNKHMIFFMEHNPDSDKKFIKQASNITRAIYYYKRGLSNKINPIRLEDEENLTYLLQMFDEYSERALNYLNRMQKRHLNWITKKSSINT